MTVKRYHIKEVQNLEVLCDVCESVIVGRQYRCVKCDKDLCQAHRRVLHVEYSNSGSEVAEFSIRPRAKSRCKALSCRGRNASLSSAVTKTCRCQSRNRWHSSDHRWTWLANASVTLRAKSTSTGKACSGANVAFMGVLYAGQVLLASD